MLKQKYRIAAALAVILAGATLGRAAGRDLDIVYPPSDVSVVVEAIRVIGRAGDGPVTVTVGGGDQTVLEVTPRNGAFGRLVTLAMGANTITAEAGGRKVTRVVTRLPKKEPRPGNPTYFLHTANEITGRCGGCHAGETDDYTNVEQRVSCVTNNCHHDFGDKTYKHGPFADGKCIECHQPHGTENRNFLRGRQARLCYRCHADAEGMTEDAKYVHFPVAKGECLSCHEPHQSDLEYHLKRDSITELCLGCHDKKLLAHQYMHDPVESGDCNACHTPHVSQVKGLLYAAGKELCLTCHEVRKEEFESRYVHEPVSKDCGLCHDPHGSESPFHLRTIKKADGSYNSADKPVMASCLRCHRKLDPQMTAQLKGKYQHKPVKEGKCTTCHTPHSTNFKKQLKAPERQICFSCHPKTKERIQSSLYRHGPVRTNDCGQCHLVHGSDHKKLLRANYTNKYSAPFKESLYALCFNCHNKAVFLNPKSLDTGFRNGTLNLHYLHVNRKKGRTCRTCHDTHASNQEKHVREKVPYKKRFTINIEFTKTATGGGCVVGCHKPRQYDRRHPRRYKKRR